MHGTLHLFLELTTLAFFIAVAAHAWKSRGELGLWLIGSMLALGFLRENFVILKSLLYGFSDLHLMFGIAPLIASIIWPYSIYISLCWAEEISGQRLEEASSLHWRTVLAAGLFMVALVGFYEPLLGRVGMARWESGTLHTAGVPWIALIGYPCLAVPFLVGFSAIMRRFGGVPRGFALTAFVAVLGVGHAAGLQGLKNVLGW